MSNVLNGNPIIITSNLASYKAAYLAAGLGKLNTLRVSKIEFLSTVTTDTVSVTDPLSGNVLAVVAPLITASVPVTLEFEASPILWQDFAVSITLTGTGNSGLYIYTRY